MPGDGRLRIIQANLQSGWGGGEEAARLLGRGLRERGHEVSFLSYPGSPLQRRMEAEAFPVATVRARAQVDPRAVVGLARHLARSRPHVLHLHTARESLTGALAGRMAGVPAVVITRHLVMPVKPAMRWVYNRACDRVICVARAVQENLADAGVRRERTAVIHGAIDVPAFRRGLLPAPEAKRRLGCDPGETVIGIVGSLIGSKGHHHFLEAARRLSAAGVTARFLLVGDGPLRETLVRQADDLGLRDQALFLGFRRDIPEVVSAFDVFVFAFVSGEAFPLSILEAMTARKPVVSTRISGTPEAVEDGVTGLLVSPGDATGLARAIGRVIESPELGRRLAEGGHERVTRCHDVAPMATATEALYRSLLNSGRPKP